MELAGGRCFFICKGETKVAGGGIILEDPNYRKFHPHFEQQGNHSLWSRWLLRDVEKGLAVGHFYNIHGKATETDNPRIYVCK